MRIDPRTKLVLIACLTTLAVIYDTPGQLLLLLGVTALLLLMFGVGPGVAWGYLRPCLPLFLTLFIIQAIFWTGPGGRGQALLAVGRVAVITGGGLEAGAGVVLRLCVVIVVAILLTTASSRDFILGLVQWGVPYEIAFMVSIAIRFLPVFREELINTVTAIQLRGIDLKKVPWGQKMGLYRSLLFPAAYGALLKARQLSESMEARGFRSYPQRTYLRRLRLNAADWVLMLSFLAATLVLVWLQIRFD
jgi:energy-coupling factor transport system permease protein